MSDTREKGRFSFKNNKRGTIFCIVCLVLAVVFFVSAIVCGVGNYGTSDSYGEKVSLSLGSSKTVNIGTSSYEPYATVVSFSTSVSGQYRIEIIGKNRVELYAYLSEYGSEASENRYSYSGSIDWVVSLNSYEDYEILVYASQSCKATVRVTKL